MGLPVLYCLAILAAAPADPPALLCNLTVRPKGVARSATVAQLPQPLGNMTTQSRSLRLADQLSSNPYYWPGGYPWFAITHDGGVLCHECCKSERSRIGTTTGSDGWGVVVLWINWEEDDLHCDHCGNRIESAYAEDAE